MASINSKIENLAAHMGVSPKDLAGFVACLGVWTAKGYSLEQAIEKNMDQMRRFVANAIKLSEDTEIRAEIIDAFYPA